MTGKRHTDAARDLILNALRAGNTRTAAAAYAGVARSIFYLWLERNRTFSDAVEKAEADAEVANVAAIAKEARDGTWTAAAWWLERRRHEDWGKKDEVRHTGHDGGAITVEFVTVVRPPAEATADVETDRSPGDHPDS